MKHVVVSGAITSNPLPHNINTMPTNYHEIIRGETSINLSVHWKEGRCSDEGDYHRPPYYEPNYVDTVYDEDDNDLTEWAFKNIGEDRLMEKPYTEIKPEIKIPYQ